MNGLLKFITCGSVDDGKSTLIGHILYDAKLLYADQERALELDSKVGSREGAIDYSLLLDGLMAEREQGITIDVAYRYFTTDSRSFIVADTPGHEEYTRNMAVGASFADLAIILIDASKGVLVQTRRHARICSLMGIRNFVFAVNKMDLVNYSEARFKEVEKEVAELSLELSLEVTQLIPISATEGDNVTKHSENLGWYKGKTILEYLETIDLRNGAVEKGFYMPVQRVCRPNHEFRGFEGQIEAGSVAVGDTLRALPSNEKAVVKSILVAGQDADCAITGQPVTISLNKEVDISRGCVLENDAELVLTKRFKSQVLWMDDEGLVPGTEYLVEIGSRLLPGVVTKIDYKIDVNSGAHTVVSSLVKNEIAVCEIELLEPIAAAVFKEHRTLGELILIDRVTNMTSACGVIEEISPTDEKARAVFTDGAHEGRGDIFFEYYYGVESKRVTKYEPTPHTYKVGDEIPTKGETYEYPDSFDILILRDKVAVSIRETKITAINSISEYRYGGYPAVNGRGFAIKGFDEAAIGRFLSEAALYHNESAAFDNKWLDFDTYRRIGFHSENEQ